MKEQTKQGSNTNLNQNNLTDLELRAKSQFIYSIVGALFLLVVGIGCIIFFASYLSVQNSVLIGSGILFGVVILLFASFDMKAKMRGIDNHRKEQTTMQDLYEKYKKASKPGAQAGPGAKLSSEALQKIQQGKIRKTT